MNVLGIETSCDETSVAVVKNGQDVLSNIVATSLEEHKKFGGIIPEIASRRQLEYITQVTQSALEKAGLKKSDIDSVAVTTHPGLIGSLLVGTSFARALAYSLKKPLIEVDHIKAHLYASFLKSPEISFHKPELPAIGLVVSGGHTSLYSVKDFSTYTLLGKTLDDAAGEAFDKTARILNLGYPGGPIIDRLAQQGKNSKIKFTCAPLTGTLDFSFSGIKTAVLYYHRDHQNESDYNINEVAFAFQSSVIEILVKKSIAACREKKAHTLLIGGGVAANSYLRTRLSEECLKEKIDVYFPQMRFCLDNGAMIAGLGYHLN